MRALAPVLKFSRLMVLIALLASSAGAQIRAAGCAPAGRFGRPAGHVAISHGHRPFNRGYGSYGIPYFYSDYYEPNDVQYEPPAPNPPAAPQVKAEPVPDPVLLELHGNQWVRVTNFGESSERALAAGTPTTQQTSVKGLPPAILVYRDGHTEEVSSYSIIGEAIYTKANYWNTGTWTRTIPIADLDIPATLRQNSERGITFQLPSSPNEVMIRP
jgi:hypothetical protein